MKNEITDIPTDAASYWDMILGPDTSPGSIITDYDLTGLRRDAIAEWLDAREVAAARESTADSDEFLDACVEHRASALAKLVEWVEWIAAEAQAEIDEEQSWAEAQAAAGLPWR